MKEQLATLRLVMTRAELNRLHADAQRAGMNLAPWLRWILELAPRPNGGARPGSGRKPMRRAEHA